MVIDKKADVSSNCHDESVFILAKKNNYFEFIKYLNIVLFQSEENNSILLVEELTFCFFVCCPELITHEKYLLKFGMAPVVIFLCSRKA